jgi:hypothetical protein
MELIKTMTSRNDSENLMRRRRGEFLADVVIQ